MKPDSLCNLAGSGGQVVKSVRLSWCLCPATRCPHAWCAQVAVGYASREAPVSSRLSSLLSGYSRCSSSKDHHYASSCVVPMTLAPAWERGRGSTKRPRGTLHVREWPVENGWSIDLLFPLDANGWRETLMESRKRAADIHMLPCSTG